MKIDNYAMDMHATSLTTSSISTTFTDELQVENRKRANELSSIEEEFEFIKKLQYELVNKLISLLSQNTSKPQNGLQALGSAEHECSCEHFDVQEEMQYFEKESFMYRKVSIEQETSIQQQLDVTMRGFVQSGDRKIELDMNLSFSSSYVEKNTLKEIMFYDPLVINMDGKAPDLDKLTFDFDIDMDGESDQISMLKKGSGFLALDKNGNGSIDDGKELFGTQNGNGFLDLKKYDKDGNNWIDENDAIFDKLRIWSKNEDENTLVGLGESGVGALFLGFVEGEFDFRDADEVRGRTTASGVFLNEDGTSGLLSQIDLAKHTKVLDQKPTPLSELLRA